MSAWIIGVFESVNVPFLDASWAQQYPVSCSEAGGHVVGFNANEPELAGNANEANKDDGSDQAFAHVCILARSEKAAPRMDAALVCVRFGGQSLRTRFLE